MYSVLIVDDEEPVLESYSYLIDTALDDFEVAGTARSGTEAIRTAHRNRPDVVLMDIAMPGIDGLDTIRELQHEFPDALYILSTAYERFDLARRAIPLRVFAYLVKPVSRKRFVETMIRARVELDEARARMDRRLTEAEKRDETMARETEDFMLLLTWKPFDEAAWSRYRTLFHLQSDHGFVIAMSLERPELYAQIAEHVERRYQCLWSERAHSLLIYLPDPARSEIIERFLEDTIRDAAGADADFTLSVGSRRRYDELVTSYDEAVSGIRPASGSQELLRRFRLRVREFGQAAGRTSSLADLTDLYTSLTDEAFAAWPFHLARDRIAAAFERILDDFDSRTPNGDGALSIADPVQDGMAFETRRELDAWACGVLRRLVETRERHAGQQWPGVLRQAVTYIESHYREPLQLTVVADHCGLSAGYLSRLFSEHLGVSFSDYLNSVRLEVAQRMLEDGDQPIKEISYSVGYQDPNYFSRIFKKFKGISPTHYTQREDANA